ncbi:haloacid dehalogenase-like hydrolase [Aquiflexum sp. TKW24L]|uniref:haloacid dehalogenase-like hydrolase n=1 Tax=Aquiflexum sp. TKW24L TaxID=2942212 RepID=UPI0020BD674E|nr:haloacid dehalogenase-like hydrolase [Aquiflexum sp. TKW24L]MCL6261247.1 haloacid dehalogenase-like hydrolase [Aquiflexum sp. TKW24L]
MQVELNKVYVFDVCGTLFHSNTTYDFLLFYFKRTNSVKFFLCRLVLSTPTKAIVVLLSKLGFKPDLRGFLISQLKGESIEQLEKYADRFVKEFLETRKVEFTHNLLMDAKRKGNQLILASGSIDIVVKAISRHLSIKDFFSANLKEDGKGKLTGQIHHDPKGKKESMIFENTLIDPSSLVVVTDNFDDISLIGLSGQAYIISKRKRKKMWESLLKNHPKSQIINA